MILIEDIIIMKSMTEKNTKTETKRIIDVHIIKNSPEIDKEIVIVTENIIEKIEMIKIGIVTIASTATIMIKVIINKITEKIMVILFIIMALIMAIITTVQIGKITKTMIDMEKKAINMHIMIKIDIITHIPNQYITKVLQIRINQL